MKEIILPIPGCPKYFASNFGRIFSEKYKRRIELKLQKLPNGYVYVSLRVGGRYLTKYVHQLVALTFLGPCPPGMECCHERNNRDDNHISNLRYDTHKSNCADQLKHGTRRFGETHQSAKITTSQVIEIRLRFMDGENPRSIAETLNMKAQTAWNVLIGLTWNHLLDPEGWTAFCARKGLPIGVEIIQVPGYQDYFLGSDDRVYSLRRKAKNSLKRFFTVIHFHGMGAKRDIFKARLASDDGGKWFRFEEIEALCRGTTNGC